MSEILPSFCIFSILATHTRDKMEYFHITKQISIYHKGAQLRVLLALGEILLP